MRADVAHTGSLHWAPSNTSGNSQAGSQVLLSDSVPDC
jgi:hypothetical protein